MYQTMKDLKENEILIIQSGIYSDRITKKYMRNVYIKCRCKRDIALPKYWFD